MNESLTDSLLSVPISLKCAFDMAEWKLRGRTDADTLCGTYFATGGFLNLTVAMMVETESSICKSLEMS